MKKSDYAIFFVLVILLLLWPNIWGLITGEKPGGTPPAVESVEAGPDDGSVEEDVSDALAGAPETPAEPADVVSDESEDVVADAVSETIPETEAIPEETAVLENDVLSLTVSSRGGTIVYAVMKEYREHLPEDSEPVILDMADHPALGYERLPGVDHDSVLRVIQPSDGRSIVLEGRLTGGVIFTRKLELGDGYIVHVEDSFANTGSRDLEIVDHEIRVGTMNKEKAHEEAIPMAGVVTLGVDSLPVGGGVLHWTKKIPGQFEEEQDARQLSRLPRELNWKASREPVDWVAVKNKYFTQILMPLQSEGDGMSITAWRTPSPSERGGGRPDKKADVNRVSASVVFEGQALAPAGVYNRSIEFYIGPKKFDLLADLSYNRDAVMGFDEVAYMDFIVVPTAKLLLRVLNFIQASVPPFNYGVAIMLLTIIIRVIFWPITHKSTESMRRMSELAPIMKEMKEKYKDNPQKQSQEMMALYKKHKINPLGGCIPMLIQIPVFFALFVVLRIAIELRFADFLWIRDLSAPERIIEFGFTIPLLGWDALNILPLLMTITMYFQQKLTPAGGDPQQQKIMRIMMPGMMLFFLYNFASGLALYWTTQNLLMIVQQLVYQYRRKHGLAAEKA